ncbi:MAG: hypothetical protein GY747_08730 [Planctomycetes bacterium]|nr:hypothetical protein [Planctomycetota bacterium]MCP4771270.1 hypothetical protein [Planctomycetota bacterium]MCP4862003.1 hypothetical protein [Planctomycetota bacterium]
MKLVLSLTAVALLAGSASAQILSEDFSSGIMPPAGWTYSSPNPTEAGWIPGYLDHTGIDHTGWAWHEDEFSSNGTSDSHMISPAMDLSSSLNTAMSFDGHTLYAVYLANHPTSYGDGVSTVEVTTDGGVTWTIVWTDTSTLNAYPTPEMYTPCIDLSAWDGMTGVQVAFHFYGTYAQEWWVDNVLVESGGCGGSGSLTYAITGLVGGGSATLAVTNATPGGGVLLAYSLTGAGPTNTPFGPVDMSAPITQLPMLTANAAGTASLTTGVPARASGFTVYTQGADLSSATLTNSLAEVVL